MIVGLISDTHNLIRSEALEALSGVEQILHAGDVCNQEVLDSLSTVAPVIAVRGNCDPMPWAAVLPETVMVELGGVWFYIIHNLSELNMHPARSGVRVVLSGHTHDPRQCEKDGVLYVNPGSAGPRRFSLPVSVALLTIEGDSLDLQMVPIA